MAKCTTQLLSKFFFRYLKLSIRTEAIFSPQVCSTDDIVQVNKRDDNSLEQQEPTKVMNV